MVLERFQPLQYHLSKRSVCYLASRHQRVLQGHGQPVYLRRLPRIVRRYLQQPLGNRARRRRVPASLLTRSWAETHSLCRGAPAPCAPRSVPHSDRRRSFSALRTGAVTAPFPAQRRESIFSKFFGSAPPEDRKPVTAVSSTPWKRRGVVRAKPLPTRNLERPGTPEWAATEIECQGH